MVGGGVVDIFWPIDKALQSWVTWMQFYSILNGNKLFVFFVLFGNLFCYSQVGMRNPFLFLVPISSTSSLPYIYPFRITLLKDNMLINLSETEWDKIMPYCTSDHCIPAKEALLQNTVVVLWDKPPAIWQQKLEKTLCANTDLLTCMILRCTVK